MAILTYDQGFFPFPVATTTTASDVGIGTPYLLGYSFDQVIEIFYRAKQLNVFTNTVGKVNAGGNAGVPGYPTVDVGGAYSSPTVIDFTTGPSPKPTELSGLTVVFLGTGNTSPDSVHYTEPGPTQGGITYTYQGSSVLTILVELFFITSPSIFIGNIQSPRIVFYNGLYYPSFFFSLQLSLTSGVPGFPEDPFLDGGTTTISSTNIQSSGVAFDATLFGVSSSGWCLATAPTITMARGTHVTVSGMTSLTLDIIEWYAYDPGNGAGPYWDASTGNMLR